MTTVRECLNELEFDWDSGVIIYQECDEKGLFYRAPGWEDPVSAMIITKDHEILDREFNTGYGSPEFPRIYAKDATAIYFPSQYDGSTEMNKVWLDPDYYLIIEHPTPYPGG